MLFGNGIFTSNGDVWKSHRRTARPMFSKNSLEAFLPHFVDKARVVLSKLEEVNITHLPSDGRAVLNRPNVDIQDLFFRFTLDAMGEVGFGHSIDSLFADVPFASAFNRSQYCIELDARNPIRNHFSNKEFNTDLKVMHDYIYENIGERKKSGDFESRTDLLSRFMALKNDETGQPFDDEYLKDVVMNFFERKGYHCLPSHVDMLHALQAPRYRTAAL